MFVEGRGNTSNLSIDSGDITLPPHAPIGNNEELQVNETTILKKPVCLIDCLQTNALKM